MTITEEKITRLLNDEQFRELLGDPNKSADLEPDCVEVLVENDINIQEFDDDLVEMYYLSYGDGNFVTKTVFLKSLNKYITLEGIDSSWENPVWTKAYFSQPFTFTETRYEKIPNYVSLLED